MYIVLEIQASDTISTIINSYTDRNTAESKYHQILAQAAMSTIPHHSAVLMNEIGDLLKSDSYTHEATA